jgi:hypothetical protein
MDETKALAIIAALANGINPLTGETFPANSPYQSPDIVRALFMAQRSLEAKRSTRGAAAAPTASSANVGQRWSDEEDRRLLGEFDRGRSVAELAKLHGRSPTGIEARLAKHGRLPMPDLPPRGNPGAREERADKGNGRAAPESRKMSFD